MVTFSEYLIIKEASYKGNLGAMEMFKFYQIASDSEKTEMKRLITNKIFDAAWDLLEKVTGVKLVR